MSEINEFYLPEEILITYIFSRLPIKSLLRFKSVNKRFNSIISSPYFAKLHLKNSTSSIYNNNSHLLINHKTCFLSFDFESFGSRDYWDCSPFNDGGGIVSDEPGLARIIDANFEVPHSHLFAIGSCDGLVCLKTKFDFMYIWNPTTLECRKIPFLRQYKKEDAVWGFGCVTSGGGRDYKIVKIRQYRRNNEKTIEVFSLLENSWTISQEKMEGFGERPKLSGLGVSFNDASYWLYYATYLYYDAYNREIRGCRWWIIGFDLVNQKLKRVPLPKGQIDGFRISPIMYVMEERLCVCWEVNEINSNHVFEIATLKEEGSTSSWINLYQLGHSYNIVPRYMSYKPESVPNITTKTRFAIKFISSNSYAYGRQNRNPPAPDTLLLMDPAKESSEYVHELKIPSSRNVVNYTESLISPFYI